MVGRNPLVAALRADLDDRRYAQQVFDRIKQDFALTYFIALLCNGSTADSGSACLGSNPSGAEDSRKWRNWHTRMFEGHVPKGLRVQIPPSARYIPSGKTDGIFFNSTVLAVSCFAVRSSALVSET